MTHVDRDHMVVDGVTIALTVRGAGPPVLLLHGYPQSQLTWERVATALADSFTVVTTDLRGYGASSKPPGDPAHEMYSKRAMAADQVGVMKRLGFDSFSAIGHDRGGRVVHRMCLDHPDAVSRAGVIDIVPTADVYAATDRALATAYFHWFFLIQPRGVPERLISGNPDRWIDHMLGLTTHQGLFGEHAVAEYKACFRDPAVVHATCEDYRAGATVDLEHDAADGGRKIACPLLVLWGTDSLVASQFDPVALWRARAEDVTGRAIRAGHFVVDEAPDEVTTAIRRFLQR